MHFRRFWFSKLDIRLDYPSVFIVQDECVFSSCTTVPERARVFGRGLSASMARKGSFGANYNQLIHVLFRKIPCKLTWDDFLVSR